MTVTSAQSPISACLGALLMVSLCGCGDDAGSTVSSENDVNGSHSSNDISGLTADVVTVDVQSTQPDTSPADGGLSGSTDSHSATDDAAAPDTTLDCPGQAGCACQSAKDCDSGFCIGTPDGQRCAAFCVDSCQAGYKCATTTGSGGDTVNICVPEFGNLCDPCNENTQCKSVGNAGAVCVDRGAAGAFCGVPCDKDDNCPASYTCSQVKDVAGNAVGQCIPKAGAACSCSESAMKANLSTKCFVASGEQKCEGVRKCLPAGSEGAPSGGGLTACLAPKPIPEVCDDQDNDCDGDKDEGTCDDDNVCTIDKCGGVAGCKYENGAGPCDADDSKCTKDDKCADGTCKAGAVLNCDDANACTQDACDPKKGCAHAAKDETPCDADDNSCTVGDNCANGACKAGPPKPCSSGDFCVLGKCSPTTGKCSYTPKAGAPCDDGNACTTGESCQDSSCVGKPVQCDDKNTCTADSCDVKTGCKHAPTSSTCDDADKCTQKDTCDSGACVGIPLEVTVACDDGNPCSKDLCKATTGCVHQPATGTNCSDGNPCTTDDSCAAGKCKAGQNVCTCNSDSDCTKHDDGDKCNGSLFCDQAKLPYSCKIASVTVVTCAPSKEFCKTNSCDPKTGKCSVANKLDGLPCDADGSMCTVGDACAAGQCAPGKAAQCDDSNECTSDSCDPKKGCKHTAVAALCDADGNNCTYKDRCKNGICHAGMKLNCDDVEPCTKDACVPSTGKCAHQPLYSACDDGSACTIADKCGTDATSKKHTCIPGKVVPCSDGKPCTFDACDAAKGCIFKQLGEGAGCDDGNKCTTADRCEKGDCKGTPLLVQVACDDKNACTVDACDSKVGCTHVAKKNGSLCEDGDSCTTPDTCQTGKCVAGKNACACQSDADCKIKDDGNPCNGTMFCDKSGKTPQCAIDPKTVVTCDTSLNGPCQTNACDPFKSKCALKIKPAGTLCDADNSKCTPIDTCALLSGKMTCVAGKPLNCDDLNPCTIDACDATKGCVHVNNQGKCDADGNACTADVCKDGKCTDTGTTTSCDDGNACTADSCDKQSGACVNKALTSSCDDGDACTSGDKCGALTGGKHGCVGGTKKSCDDSNDCTADSCDPKSGCKHKAETGKKVACWTGADNQRGKGVCTDGERLCKSDGSQGPCENEVKAQPKEICNGKDDTCNGTTDEGCAPTGFKVSVGGGRVAGGLKHITKARFGGGAGAVSSVATTKLTAHYGWYGWLRGLTKSK